MSAEFKNVRIGEHVSLSEVPHNAIFSVDGSGKAYMRADDGGRIPLGFLQQVENDGEAWQKVKVGPDKDLQAGALLIPEDAQVLIFDLAEEIVDHQSSR